MSDIDLKIARRAVEIAAVCLVEAGVCRYENPATGCRRVYLTKADCYGCLERWLLHKAQREIIKKETEKL